jgi:nucleoside-diphosphate-sugar epimerase
MSLQGKKICLIGGAGFIGHNLAIELVRRGAHVEAIDGLQVNNLLYLTTEIADPFNRNLYLKMVNQRLDLMREYGIVLHPQDARDYHALSRIISNAKPDCIVQLAAVAHANRSNKDPFSTFDHSLRTLENALDVARSGTDHFVYFSSSMVYGNWTSEAVEEDHPLNPIGIYGALKVAGEKIVLAYNQVFNLQYTIVRPSALYGERCVSRRVGQVFIENAMQGQTLRVDGDGSDRLDFTYIKDLIQGVCLCIEKPAARNQTFNLTHGHGRSIAELVQLVRSHFPRVEVESVNRDRLMPERGTLSVAKAKKFLGYEPAFPIEAGIPKYVDWYKSQARAFGFKGTP